MDEYEDVVEFVPDEEPEEKHVTQITLPASTWAAMEVFTHFNQKQLVV